MSALTFCCRYFLLIVSHSDVVFSASVATTQIHAMPSTTLQPRALLTAGFVATIGPMTA